MSESHTPVNPEDLLPFKLDASYQGNEVTQKVKDILNLPSIAGWSVIDHDEENELALVHYNSDADMNSYGKLRGILVSTKYESVVADSYGYTPTVVAQSLNPDTNNQLHLVDTEGNKHDLDLAQVKIKKTFEGVVMRVCWFNGKIFFVTHKKINPYKSKWGTSIPFKEMYVQANGPTEEQLFDTTKPYSSTCYVFLVVHPALLVGTRQRVNAPYLVFLGTQEHDLNVPAEQVAVGRSTFTVSKTFEGTIQQSLIHEPEVLSLEKANQHLKYGYFQPFEVPDERLATGESVVLCTEDSIIKVNSISFQWRSQMRGENPNIMHQFYLWTGKARDDDPNELFKYFVPFQLVDVQALQQMLEEYGALHVLPIYTDFNSHYHRESRIHVIFLNFLISLPLHQQMEALKLYGNFLNERDQLIRWLVAKEKELTDLSVLSDNDLRLKQIIADGRAIAKTKLIQAQNYGAKGNQTNLPIMIASVIRNFIMKERGDSLYKLVRMMKKEEKEKAKAQTK